MGTGFRPRRGLSRRGAVAGGLAGALAAGLLFSMPAAALGRITEFTVATPASSPWDIAPGADGALWFTERTSHRIGRAGLNGGIVDFPLSGSPVALVAGPDGNVWVAEQPARVARVNRAGAVTEFSLPNPRAQPTDITAGPDGDLWVSDQALAVVWRLDTAGVATAVSTGKLHLLSLTSGGDGNLWFTNGNRIGRLTTSGAITLFRLVSHASTVVDLTPGPDGNVWFTDSGLNAVGRITPAGAVIEYGIPTPNSSPAGITTGPDGNLWFVESALNGKVGQVSMAGAFTEFAIPSVVAGALNIAPAADGNLWFTEPGTNVVARLEQASHRAYIEMLASGPALRSRAVNLGATVQWMFLGPQPASATDSSGVGAFDSGVRTATSFYQFQAFAAGTYAYSDVRNLAHQGVLWVAPQLSPTAGGPSLTFTVTWATRTAPAPDAYDVQIAYCPQFPCTPQFAAWRTATAVPSAGFNSQDPAWRGPGIYAFRSALVNTGNGARTGWSPPVLLDVTPS